MITCSEHDWRPVHLTRTKRGQELDGMICRHCPSVRWAGRDDEEDGVTVEINPDQWKWWHKGLDGKDPGPWPTPTNEGPMPGLEMDELFV